MTDLSSEQVREAYARFGLAMSFCQCIERQLATLLATKYGPGVRQLTQSEYDESLQSLFKQTRDRPLQIAQEREGIW